ncbi:MAG: hypothetical protein R3F43_19845 [bacterium]
MANNWKSAQDALAACAELAWTRQVFNAATRACLLGQAPARDPVGTDALSPRTPAPNAPGLDEPRARLARDPEDVALRALGEILLDAGDAHVRAWPSPAPARWGAGPSRPTCWAWPATGPATRPAPWRPSPGPPPGAWRPGGRTWPPHCASSAWRRPPTPPCPLAGGP